MNNYEPRNSLSNEHIYDYCNEHTYTIMTSSCFTFTTLDRSIDTMQCLRNKWDWHWLPLSPSLSCHIVAWWWLWHYNWKIMPCNRLWIFKSSSHRGACINNALYLKGPLRIVEDNLIVFGVLMFRTHMESFCVNSCASLNLFEE